LNVPEPRDCPAPDVLGCFIDGTLSEERWAWVTWHLARCARCRLVVENVAEFEEEEQPAAEPRQLVPHSVVAKRLVALAAGVAAAVIAYPLAMHFSASLRPNMITRLAAAMPASERTIEPRLTGGFRWAPLQDLRRSGSQARSPEELIAAGAAGSILRQIGNDQRPDALHAAGVAYLVAGKAGDAVATLGQAVHAAPRDAKAWSDLAAAFYCVAAQRDDPSDMRRALDAVNQAIQLDPRLAEAYFNRAVILQGLGPPGQVASAWQAYLGKDPQSAWAAEARQRLRDLESPSGATKQ
jgi:hypothetical protein